MIKSLYMRILVFMLLILFFIPSFSQKESVDVVKLKICHTPHKIKFRREPHFDHYKKRKCDFCDDAFFQLVTIRIPKEIDTEEELLYYFTDKFVVNIPFENPIIRGKVVAYYSNKKKVSFYINPEGYFIYNSKFYKNDELLTILLQYFSDDIIY